MTLARGLAWIAVPPQGPARSGSGKEGRAILLTFVNKNHYQYRLYLPNNQACAPTECGRPGAACRLAFCDNAGADKIFSSLKEMHAYMDRLCRMVVCRVTGPGPGTRAATGCSRAAAKRQRPVCYRCRAAARCTSRGRLAIANGDDHGQQRRQGAAHPFHGVPRKLSDGQESVASVERQRGHGPAPD